MSAETILNIVVSILVLVSTKVVATIWDEVKVLRKTRHRHANILTRHESGIEEAREKLGLDPMPPLVEND